jgi:hypothetical protein
LHPAHSSLAAPAPISRAAAANFQSLEATARDDFQSLESPVN